MKVIIAGGRDFDNYEYLSQTMNSLDILISEVISGCARGADSLGELWAKNNNIPVTHFPADWHGSGKAAGMERNQEMAEYGDYLVAFWDGKSRGTLDMINRMQQCGKHGKVVRYESKTDDTLYPW